MDKAGIPQPKMGDSYLRHRVSLWLEATDLDLELDPSGLLRDRIGPRLKRLFLF